MKRWAVYSGGNGHGAFQAGVNEYIAEKRGIHYFDTCCGISAGAINAAAWACHRVSAASDLWQNLPEDKIVKRRGLLAFAASVAASRLLPWKRKQTGFYDTAPLRDTLLEFFAGARYEAELYVGRVNLWTGDYIDDPGGNIGMDVWHSTLIPIMMKADVQNTAIWVDGGIHNTKPLSRVVEYGNDGDEVFIINATQTREPKPMMLLPREADVIDIARSTIEYLVAMNTVKDLRLFMARNHISGFKSFNTTVIEPTIDMGDGNDYSLGARRTRWEHGYERARAVLNG